jgi:acyl-CoA dehydrogenase
VVAAQALKLAGGQEALLEQVAGGELKLATAFNEPQARYELNNVTVTAKGGKLNGRKVVVIHGAQADKLVVSARTSGAQSDRDGISLFLVDTKGAGVSVKDYRTIDNLRAADVTFQDAPATLLGTEGKGWDVLEATADYAAVLLCAEAVGVMDTLNAATLEYAKTAPAVRRAHRALPGAAAPHGRDVHPRRAVALDHAAGRGALRRGQPEERRRYVSAAKARVGRQPARSARKPCRSTAAWA